VVVLVEWLDEIVNELPARFQPTKTAPITTRKVNESVKMSRDMMDYIMSQVNANKAAVRLQGNPLRKLDLVFCGCNHNTEDHLWDNPPGTACSRCYCPKFVIGAELHFPLITETQTPIIRKVYQAPCKVYQAPPLLTDATPKQISYAKHLGHPNPESATKRELMKWIGDHVR
jgi:hypothetical protein